MSELPKVRVTPEDDRQSTNGTQETSMHDNNDDVDGSRESSDGTQYLPVPNKPGNDKRNYRVIKLANGFTALLISDFHTDAIPENDSTQEIGAVHNDVKDVSTELQTQSGENHSSKLSTKINYTEERKATCGLCIAVGDSSDPPEVSGMAKFMQHLVVTGSELRSRERESEFLLKHFGTIEAFTTCEDTHFKFTVVEKLLHETLYSFSQFFIRPILKNDVIRLRQIIALRDNMTNDTLYEKLDRFKKRHYRAHNMAVAIEAGLPLDTLEKFVKECFSRLPHNPLPDDYFPEFTGTSLLNISEAHRKCYFINARDNVKKIEYVWKIDSSDMICTTKSLRYVSWILSHKGKGSLFSYLRKEKLCRDVSCRTETIPSPTSRCTRFTLSLTETNEEYNSTCIEEAVFSYINLMRREAPQKRIYDEIEKIEEAKFRFSDEVRRIDVSNLCRRMLSSAPVDYVAGSDLRCEYDPVSIKACVDALTPNNLNCFVFMNPVYETSMKIEPWFKTTYDEFGFGSFMEEWNNLEPYPEYTFPEANVFLADDFALKTALMGQPRYPVMIYTNPLLEVWCKPDTKLSFPVCHMNFHYVSPLPLTTPANAAMLDLYVRGLKYLMLEELYPATVAGLKYNITASDRGLMVEAGGFSHKLPLLLEKITKYIVEFPTLMSAKLSDMLYHEQRKEYYETFSKPDILAEDIRLCIVRLVHWSAVDKREGLNSVLYDEFVIFAKFFVKSLYIQCFAQGNLEHTDVIRTAKETVKVLKCRAIQQCAKPRTRATEIPLGVTCCRVENFDPTNAISCVKNYYQLADASNTSTTTIELINTLMDDPSFEVFRAQKSLDRYKYRLAMDTLETVGYSVIGSDCSNFMIDPSMIDDDIEKFRATLNTVLTEITDVEFLKIKEALTRVKQAKDVNIEEEVKRNWATITSELYEFDRPAQEVRAINEMKLEDFRKWMAGNTIDGLNLRKLSVQVVGNNPNNTGNKASKYDQEKEYSLNYLTDLPIEPTTTCYVTDMDKYKRRDLHVFAVTKS